MRKILYIVLDGLGDLPFPKLNNQTPLEAAKKPNLDSLIKKGKAGLAYTVGKGIAPESDIAVISILGYDAAKYYTGRGPLESYAEGFDVKDGDLAFRVNFATIGEGRNLLDRRVGRNLTTEEATSLSKDINQKVKLTSHPADFKFKNTIGHRGVLVIYPKGYKLSAEITNTDPAYEKEGVFGVAKEKFENVLLDARPAKGFEKDPASIASADLLNEFTKKSQEALNASAVNKKRMSEGKLAGNIILSRDAGNRLPKFPDINGLYNRKFASFVEMPVEKGIAVLTGMQVVNLPLPTGNPQKDYPVRAQRALEEIKNFDCLYIHLKGPDEPAHDGDGLKKKASIEAIDEFFFGNLLKDADLKTTLICVTADHSTPCILKAHSDDPVPVLISGLNVESDGLETFCEKSCRNGSLGVMSGREILPLLIKLTS